MSRRRATVPGLLALLLLAALTCALPPPGDPPAPTPARPTPTPAPTAAPLRGQPVNVELPPARGRFAPYRPLPVSNSVQRGGRATAIPLAQLRNPADLWPLNEAQRAALADQGLVVQPTAEPDLLAVYRQAAADGRPVVITTDVLTYATSQLLAQAWLEAETTYLRPDLQALVPSLLAASERQVESLGPAGPVADAARFNLAYLAVAARLLAPDQASPAAVAAVVADELSLIRQAAGVFQSPLLRQTIDYRQFAPTGPYTAPEWEGPYQCLVWLSQAWPLDGDPATARHFARTTLLLLQALAASQNESRWARIYDTRAYFLGQPDGFSWYELNHLAGAVYGGPPSLAQPVDEARLDDFILTVRAVADRAGAPAAFALFNFDGQRHQPDAALTPALTFNQVGALAADVAPPPPTAVAASVGLIRALPRRLDLAAVLGSDAAESILAAEGELAYDEMPAQMARLQARHADLDPATWTDDLPRGWWYALQPLLTGRLRRAWPAIESEAWHRRRLWAWQAGWTEQFRRAVLVQQTQPPAASAAQAYIEPDPLLYARLAALLRQVQAGLTDRGLLGPELAERLATLETTLLALKRIAEKELADQPLTPDERGLLAALIQLLEAQLTFVQPDGGRERFDPLLVATWVEARGSDELAQVVLDGAWPLYLVVPDSEAWVVAAGAVAASYELRRPAGEPLDAASWREQRQQPAPPAWLDSFVVP